MTAGNEVITNVSVTKLVSIGKIVVTVNHSVLKLVATGGKEVTVMISVE